MLILWHLREETKRFGTLKNEIPHISPKMLAQQLRELEETGLVYRRVYAEVPPRVEYSLTVLGLSLEPILEAICRWGKSYQETHQSLSLKSRGRKKIEVKKG